VNKPPSVAEARKHDGVRYRRSGRTAEVDEEVPKSQRTYAEIAVACDLTDEAEQQISDTFDAGIGFLRQFQRA
jgi:hypothetical protein